MIVLVKFIMKRLWFKSIYISDILSGVKSETIRKFSLRLPVVGDKVLLSCGPRTPFATVEIVSVDPLIDLPKDRRISLAKIYPHFETMQMVILRFRLLQE